MEYNYTDFTKSDNFNNVASSGSMTSTTDFEMANDKIVVQKKRPYPYRGYKYGEPPAKRSASIQLGAGFKWNLQALANAADSVESGGKSPVSALNELGVKVMYTVLRQGGPAHCPSFNVAVTQRQPKQR